MIVQTAGDARVVIDLAAGCRLASLQIAGHELLITSAPDPIDWGCYPMAPYAGRVRDGSFSFAGTIYSLPRTLGGHAIHGTAYLRSWQRESDHVFSTELGSDWPFPGTVVQEIRLEPDQLALRLEVHATEGPMPASCGWHPWFRRSLAGRPAVLDFRPGYMLARDAAGIATRVRQPVSPGPWDDCFGEVAGPPTLTWPGVLSLRLDSDCPSWVVFDGREHSICVEPQTAPPDALNHDPDVVRPGRPLVAHCTFSWIRPAGRPGG